MVLEIRGTAHPPPPRAGRGGPADLSAAEIASTNIAGAPLLNEHDASARVGTCLASWQGADGSLRIAARVDDPAAERAVRSGTMRGLSLGTDLIMSEEGEVLFRGQKECSICEEGKRDGTWMTHINNVPVHRTVRASKRGARAAANHNPRAAHARVTREPVPMTDLAPIADASVADSNRDDLVERLKRELAEKTEGEARANARAHVFEEKERSRVASYADEAKFFLKEWIPSEVASDAEAKADVAPLGTWADEFASKQDIVSQTPLARMCFVASKGVKRLRDEASQLPEMKESLANTMKQLEELTASKDKLQRENDDQRTLLDERQASLEKLNERIAAAGLAQEKFNFAKATAREVEPPAEPEKVAATTKLEAATVNASKSANPFDGQRDHLLDFINTAGGGGSGRMNASATGHALLGHQGDVDVATLLRGA